MALPAAFELMNYWARYPTPSMMMRSYFGIKPPAVDEEEVRKAVTEPEVVTALGPMMPLSDQARELIEWAERQKGKLN
jgi:hypothetical protein